VFTAINETRVVPYSLYTFGTEFPGISYDPNDFGILFIQAFYFTFTLLMPIIQCILLIVLWLIPFKLSFQRKFFFIIEICHAWATFDVQLIALLTASFQVSQFVQYILEGTHRCDFINEILVKYFSAVLDGDEKCVDMSVSFNSGIWFVVVACVLYIIVVNVVMKLMRFGMNSSPVEIIVHSVQ